MGTNCKIGAGSVVLEDVDKNSTVIGVTGRIIYRGDSDPLQSMADDLKKSPDPVAQAIKCLLEKIPKLEKELKELKKLKNINKKSVKKTKLLKIAK